MRGQLYKGIAGIYDANQIIGKTLFAARPVSIKRYPTGSAAVVYTAPTGAAIGRVYSWVMDGPDLWWQFLDANQKAYYAKHVPGSFSIDALQQQGAMTVEEVQQAQDAAGKSWWENLFGGVGSGAKTAITVGAVVIVALLVSKFSK